MKPIWTTAPPTEIGALHWVAVGAHVMLAEWRAATETKAAGFYDGRYALGWDHRSVEAVEKPEAPR